MTKETQRLIAELEELRKQYALAKDYAAAGQMAGRIETLRALVRASAFNL